MVELLSKDRWSEPSRTGATFGVSIEWWIIVGLAHQIPADSLYHPIRWNIGQNIDVEYVAREGG
jgi:hypothetical protein